MRNLLKYLSVFLVLTILISGLAACGSNSNTVVNSAANDKMPPLSNTTTGTETPKAGDSSQYPILPANIAKADFEALDGSTFKVEDRKGKVLLLNLWGIWCGPCRAEMPDLVELQTKYKDRNFQILGLNVGDEDNNPEKFEDIKAFGEKMHLNYELVRVSSQTSVDIMKASTFGGVPQSLLVDRDGHLRGVFTGAGPNVISKLKTNIEKVVSE